MPSEPLERRIDQVRKIWSIVCDSKTAMNINHFNALLQMHLENEHPFDWREMLQTINASQSTLNQLTYELIFEQLCRNGSMDEANRFLEDFAEGFGLTEKIYCSKMLGYARIGDMANVLAIPTEMQQRKVQQTFRTTVTMMKCYAQCGDIDKIINILNSYADENGMGDVDVDYYITDSGLMDVVFELCKNGYENRIDAVVQRMKRFTGYHFLAKRMVVALISRGKVDGAYNLLKSIPRQTQTNGKTEDVGKYVIMQMIVLRHSVESIIAMSRRLTDDGMNSRAIYDVLEISLQEGYCELSLVALKELQRLREPIRLNYFWPLLCSESSKDTEKLIALIQQMRDDFHLIPDDETVIHFISSQLSDWPANRILRKFQEFGIRTENIVPLLVLNSLDQCDIESACTIASCHFSVQSKYHTITDLRNKLKKALSTSEDFISFGRFVKIVNDSIEQANTDKEVAKMQLDLVGSILFDAIFQSRKPGAIEAILRSFVAENLLISPKQGNRIRQLLKTKDNSMNFTYYLNALTAPTEQNRTHSKVDIELSHKGSQKAQLLLAVNAGNADDALRIWEDNKLHESLSAGDTGRFVKLLQTKNRTEDAAAVVKQAVVANIRLPHRTWHDLLTQLGAEGHISALDEFKQIENWQSIIPADDFNYAIFMAHLQSGKCEEYLARLENDAIRAKKANDLENFPLTSAIRILSRYPKLLDACKYAIFFHVE